MWGQVDKATGGVLGRSHTDRGELGVEIQRLVQFAVHRRHDCMAAVRIQGVGECVREHGVRLISMKVLWSTPAAVTAWWNRTGLRRLADQ